MSDDKTGSIVCGTCGANTPWLPHDGHSWAALWDAGWRWKGLTKGSLKFVADTFVFSCRSCPSVLGPPSGPVFL